MCSQLWDLRHFSQSNNTTTTTQFAAPTPHASMTSEAFNEMTKKRKSTTTMERVLTGHTMPVSCLSILGNTLVSGSEDCNCFVWNLQNGTITHKLQANHPIKQVQILN